MRYLRALCMCLAVTLTACASYTNVSSKPSVDLLVRCPDIAEQPLVTFGDTVKALNYTIDMYYVCAKRNDALIEYELRKK